MAKVWIANPLKRECCFDIKSFRAGADFYHKIHILSRYMVTHLLTDCKTVQWMVIACWMGSNGNLLKKERLFDPTLPVYQRKSLKSEQLNLNSYPILLVTLLTVLQLPTSNWHKKCNYDIIYMTCVLVRMQFTFILSSELSK